MFLYKLRNVNILHMSTRNFNEYFRTFASKRGRLKQSIDINRNKKMNVSVSSVFSLLKCQQPLTCGERRLVDGPLRRTNLASSRHHPCQSQKKTFDGHVAGNLEMYRKCCTTRK